MLDKLVITNNPAFSTSMRRSYCNTNKILYDIFLMFTIFSFVPTSANQVDHVALLDLKSRVLKDPLNIMSSWNDSMHFCSWIGVICNSTVGRVMILHLEAQSLSGSIPPSLGNLTYLTEIRLGDNNFHSQIPQEFGRLLQLRHLNLSHNNFDGEIPANISHCTKLLVLDLAVNELVGRIPRQLSTLTMLEQLRFGGNNLTGTIPSWIGNFSSIFRMSFSYNNFQGNIPNELGHLSRLEKFSIDMNYLTGTIPLSIYNITSLVDLSLTQNRLEGLLPLHIGSNLPNLLFFLVGINNFSGPVPPSFANISRLKMLDISENSLTGIPPNNLGSLRDLEMLNLEGNNLGNGKIGDLNFINFLANCTGLQDLGLGINRLGGPLPPSIGNLSDQLKRLTFGQNMLTGSIPIEIENLINLQILGMEYNYVSGSIPPNIGKLQKLGMLYLNNNRLTGPIPSSIGNLSLVTKLFIDNNKLEGSIPPSLGQCKSLLDFSLSHNDLSGSIPKEVLGLSSISISLTLNNNSLSGPLPSDVGQLVNLAFLDVSDNKLSGNIPSNLGKCISMELLYLGGNRFEGFIPSSFNALKGLEELNLSRNSLSGPIPQFLCKLPSLKYLNLSYNNFEGKVPKEGVFSNSTMFSIIGNNNLCDDLQELQLPLCPLNQTHSSNKLLAPKVLIPIVSIGTFTLILLSIIFVCFVLMKSRKKALTSSSTQGFLPQISYLELSKSTDGFSMDNLIDSGSFGSVYKGTISNDGLVVAIKVLNLQQQGASKSFVDECKALTCIRHRNLLKIITSCSSIDVQGNEFKALVFPFMSSGNLDSWLHIANHGHNRRRLSLIQRLDIAIDIANALDYLHNHCETSIVHCDLKPSNVLLDDDMVAHVGDFGLAKLMLEGENQSSLSQTMSLVLKGSIGYIPPEYGTASRISIEGDIFSFGILLLEMIIGRRPTDDTFGDGVNIHMFTEMALLQGALDIVDPYLLFEETQQQEEDNEDRMQEKMIMSEENHRKVVPRWMEECLVSVMRIGLCCSSTTPRERTSMNFVVIKLQTIRSSYLKFKKTSQRVKRG